MKIEVIPETALSNHDDAQIATLLGDCFETDFGNRSYFQQRPHVRLVHRANDGITGHIGLGFRDIRLGDALVPVIGICDVATAPTERGKGVASALLKEAITFSKTTQAAFIVLFGNRPLYAGHGFENKRQPIRFVRLNDAKSGTVENGHAQELMVMQILDIEWPDDADVDFVGHLF